MTWEIAFVLGLLLLTLIAFMRELGPPDLIAMTAFCIVVAAGLITVSEGLTVFKNDAPITIGALFVLTAALNKTGAMDALSRLMEKHLRGGLRYILLLVCFFTAACSAFINNTPLVAMLMPVLLGLARSRGISPSKLLIPLSYSSLLGGCCTLIGTSTNIIVNGMLPTYGQPSLSMFELAPIGLPLALVGLCYITIFAPKLLPNRIAPPTSDIASAGQRSCPLYHVLVSQTSPLIGKKLEDTPLWEKLCKLSIIEFRRQGVQLMTHLNEIAIEPLDRILLGVDNTEASNEITPQELDQLMADFRKSGLEILPTLEGRLFKAVIAPHSKLVGKRMSRIDFRQRYGVHVQSFDRSGGNIHTDIKEVPMEFGDTLHMLSTARNLPALRACGDFLMFDEEEEALKSPRLTAIAWMGFALVVILSVFNIVPIVAASLLACLLVLWAGCVTPKDAYASVEWPIIFMLYGMLGVGMALEKTGAAEWLAHGLVEIMQAVVPALWLPVVVLSSCYLLTSLLTEVLSNNATAVAMTPIVINVAKQLELNPRPFIIAVTIGASAAFILPIGYQTHMMVYGPGGYRFTDYMKLGLPLSIMCWLISSILIPIFWPLQ